MWDDRPILELPPAHLRILARHRQTLGKMLRAVVTRTDLRAKDLGAVIAAKGEFAAVAAEAGEMFVLPDEEHGIAVVVVLVIAGLEAIAEATVPDAVLPILERNPEELPALIVIDDDPALALLAVAALLVRPS